MKKISILFVLVNLILVLNAQNTFLNKLNYLNNPIFEEQFITGIIENSCGRIYTLNSAYNNPGQNHGTSARVFYPQLAKHYSNGDMVLQKTGNSSFDIFSKFILGSDGFIYSCSRNRLHLKTEQLATLNGDFLVRKNDPDDLSNIWTKKYTVAGYFNDGNGNTTNVQREGLAYDLIESFDENGVSDGFVACGSTTVYLPGNGGLNYNEMTTPGTGGNDNDGISDGLGLEPSVVKFANDGTILWGFRLNIHTLNSSSSFYIAEKVVQTPDGGYLLVGISDPEVVVSGTKQINFLKLDRDGNLLWVQSTGNTYGQQIMAVDLNVNELTILTDDNYITRFTINSMGVTSNFSKKLVNSSGNNYSVKLNDFVRDGNFYAFIGTYNSDYNNGIYSAFCLKTDNNFNFTNPTNVSNVFSLDFTPRKIIKSNIDNYFYIGGETEIIKSSVSNKDDLILIKLDNGLNLTSTNSNDCEKKDYFPTAAWYLETKSIMIEDWVLPEVTDFGSWDAGDLEDMNPLESETITCKKCSNNTNLTITASSPSPLCSGINSTFTASAGYYYYVWTYTPNSGPVETILTCNSSYTDSRAGTYSVVGFYDENCFSNNSNTLTIHQKPSTTIVFTPNVTGMCLNESNPVTISSSTTASIYDWEYIPPSNAIWTPNTISFIPQGIMLETGNANINLKVQSSSGCWSDLVSSTFDIWAVPVPNFTNTTVCAINDIATAFTNTTTGPQTTYAWDFGNSSGTSASASPTYDYTTAGSYNVKLTVTESTHGCMDEITKSVTVKPNPTVDFSTGTIFCEQQTITFTDNSSLSGNTISSRYWDWNDGTNTTTATQTQDHLFIPTFPGSSTSVNYSVKLRSTASNGCYDEKIRILTINKKPAQPTLSVATNAQNHTNVICVGEQYTLNASPSTGYNYSWFFNGNSMGAFYNNFYSDYGVGPLPDSRPYTVRITDANGCYNTSATSTILVKHVNTAINYISGFTTLCPGATVTLTGSVPTSTQAYEWYRAPYDPVTMTYGAFGVVGTNSKTHLVDNSNPGRYKYKGTLNISGGDACIDESTTIDVINALPLTLNYTGTVNINLLSPQALTFVPSAYPTYNSFKWYRNDILVSTLASYPITKPGKYYLIATGSCGIEKSNVVEFKFDCTSVGYNNLYTGTQNFTSGTTNLNPGTVTPTVVLMNGDWNLTGGAVVNISNLTIVAGNCAKFNVTNGTLNLTNANIVGCAEWNGIVIDGSNSTLNMSGGTVSEAVVGITSKNRGTLNVTQGEFDNNMVHIGFSQNGVVNSSLISFNKFGNLNLNTPSCTHPDLPGWNIVNKPMVYLEQVTGPTLVGNEFICNNTNNAIIVEGIQSKGSNSLTISNNSDQGYLSRGINIREGNALSIGDNTFNFRYFPPLDMFNSRSNWTNTGILMVDTKGSTVDRNLVTDADEGIAYYLNTTVPVTNTNITRNRMENCFWGLVSATKENPATSVAPYQNSSAQTIYVQVNCNTFNSCNYGWIGTGTYQNQGSSGNPVNNSFNSITGWNTCVMGLINYYRTFGVNNYNPYFTVNGIVNLDGNSINTTNRFSLCFQDVTTINNNSCTNKRSTTAQDPIDAPKNAKGIEIKVSSYPNPFTKEIELRIENNEDNKTFKVEFYDLTGKVILSENVSNISQTFDTSDWAVGIYFIRVSNSDGTIYQQKLVKTE